MITTFTLPVCSGNTWNARCKFAVSEQRHPDADWMQRRAIASAAAVSRPSLCHVLMLKIYYFIRYLMLQFDLTHICGGISHFLKTL